MWLDVKISVPAPRADAVICNQSAGIGNSCMHRLLSVQCAVVYALVCYVRIP